MNVRKEIVTQFKQVAQEQNKRLAPLTDELELLNPGLVSLCFAILLAGLKTPLDSIRLRFRKFPVYVRRFRQPL